MTITDIAHLDITDEQLVESAARELAVLATAEPPKPPYDYEADLEARMQAIREEVIRPKPLPTTTWHGVALDDVPIGSLARIVLNGLAEAFFGCVCTPDRSEILAPEPQSTWDILRARR
jgi:hypothetical protein